jgi:hypothetical protein
MDDELYVKFDAKVASVARFTISQRRNCSNGRWSECTRPTKGQKRTNSDASALCQKQTFQALTAATTTCTLRISGSLKIEPTIAIYSA